VNVSLHRLASISVLGQRDVGPERTVLMLDCPTREPDTAVRTETVSESTEGNCGSSSLD
jgi:hypothetical protein